MRPVQVSVHVPFPREQVYEFLAISTNHELFNRHLLTDWSFSGPQRGVGSMTRATTALGGRPEPVDIEVVEDVPPTRIVERNVGAGGKRIATGTYSLAASDADSGTTVTFEYAWQSLPVIERLAGAIVRRVMRRALTTSMRELAATLDAEFARTSRPSS
jgi:carbon monoxide dehydrogenase subunit G